MRTLRSVDEAAADLAKSLPPLSSVHSHFMLDVPALEYKSGWRHNLTTDTATGFTNRRDWQSKAMGMGASAAFATGTGTSTATGATSLTNSGAAFPTAGQGLAGQNVYVGGVYGTILSNTATVLTIDQWTAGGSTSGAVGSTPGATSVYLIGPGQNPAAWLAITADATTPTSADTTLTSELAANGFSRAVGTYSHTAAATTYALTHLFTCTGGSTTINKEAVLGAAAGGVMPFESAEPSPPTLVSGDTLTQTVTITIN